MNTVTNPQTPCLPISMKEIPVSGACLAPSHTPIPKAMKMPLWIVSAVAAATLLAASLMAYAQNAGTRSVRLFVVAGQSNAEGHNHIRQYHGGQEEFPAALRVQSRILFWPGNDTAQATNNLWTSLRVGDSGAFGPEISFGCDIEREMPGATIAIVKYAAGGTGIARSVDYTDYIPALAGFNDKNRNWHPPTDGREAGALYSALIDNFRRAVSALERDGKEWELAGFVWMQGEHEAGISRKMAEDYEGLLTDFIRSVRKDLGAPSLPFAIGQVNSHTWAYGDVARKCQLEVCRKDKKTLLVETMDLPRVSGDASHFTADGMLTLGSRFAEAMVKLPAEPRGRANQAPLTGQ